MFVLLNALLVPLYPALALYTLHRRFVGRKSPASLAGEWGLVSREMRAFGDASEPKVWLHAVSVGETVAAKPIVAALRRELPSVRIALSSTTDTGHELAAKMAASGEVDVAFYFPLDLPFALERVLNALRPDALAFVETELWPNLLHLARKRGIPTFLLNGRVSDNLLRTAPKLGPLWKWMSGNVSRFLMRGDSDAQRLRTLGVGDERIEVVGDVKLEAPPVSSPALRETWRQRLGLTNETLLIAGSTHEGEEAILLRAFVFLRDRHPQLRLAIAPRHLDRLDAVLRTVEEAGFFVACRSRDEQPDANAVFVLDTVGELADVYAAGDFALVGGTLIERGGHNLLEPVLRGVPVLFGPSVSNFRAQAALLLEHDLGFQVKDEEELKTRLNALLLHPLPDYSQRVELVLAPHRGAAMRMARVVAAPLRQTAS